MTPQALLSRLREQGIQIRISGADRLAVDAPKGALTPELRNALSTFKTEILQELQKEEQDKEPKPLTPLVMPQAHASPADREPSALTDDSVTASDDINSQQTDLVRLKAEIEALRIDTRNRRAAAESAMRIEEEHCRKIDEEVARQRAQEERVQIEMEERARAEEDSRRKIADQEIAGVEAELQRLRDAEQQRRAEFDAHLFAQQELRQGEIESRRIADDERARARIEAERLRIESEARLRVQEEEVLRRAELRIKAIEDQIARILTRDEARRRATEDAARRSEEEARRLMEEESRRQAEMDARRRTEEEARLRARIEKEMRAEAEARRRAEAEARHRAEEENRKRAEEEARRRAEDEARRLAEEEGRRLAQETLERQAAEEEARRLAAEEARRQEEEETLRRQEADADARRRAEAEGRQRAEEEARERAELEARIRAEIEAKIREEEEADNDFAATEEANEKKEQPAGLTAVPFNRLAGEPYPQEEIAIESADGTQATDWRNDPLNADFQSTEEVNDAPTQPPPSREEIHANSPNQTDGRSSEFAYEDMNGRFQAVSIPEIDSDIEYSNSWDQLFDAVETNPPVTEVPPGKSDEAFRKMLESFDDPDAEARKAAVQRLLEFGDESTDTLTRALREATPQRRRNIGGALAASGLGNEAIENLTGENRQTTYDAFSLLFLMSKAGEVAPLMNAIEQHPNIETRLAVVKLLVLSGQPSILPAFRLMAVRGSLPTEVRSALMEAIYQMTSQGSAEPVSTQ